MNSLRGLVSLVRANILYRFQYRMLARNETVSSSQNGRHVNDTPKRVDVFPSNFQYDQIYLFAHDF